LITKISVTINNYNVFQLSNYNYNYFKNVINWLQLQIIITTSLLSTKLVYFYHYILGDNFTSSQINS